MTPPSPERFEREFVAAWSPSKWSGLTVLVACSGGADSVALLRCMVRKAPDTATIKVAHYNHQLRGSDSLADEQFVRQLSDQLNIQCIVGSADNSASSGQSHSEESLRSMRYTFLENTANELGARYIVTAHTADDQAETVLHRLCRGAGAAGLRGILQFREIGADLVLARPMLGLWREDIIAYLDGLNQPFRSDASNSSDRYTRNRIRNSVIPELEGVVHPNAKRNIVEASKNVLELYEFLEGQAIEYLERDAIVAEGERQLKIAHLAVLHPAMQKEVMRKLWLGASWPIADMNNQHWKSLIEMISEQLREPSGQSQKSFPGNVLVHARDGIIGLKRS